MSTNDRWQNLGLGLQNLKKSVIFYACTVRHPTDQGAVSFRKSKSLLDHYHMNKFIFSLAITQMHIHAYLK